jgi:hypothetical protein
MGREGACEEVEDGDGDDGEKICSVAYSVKSRKNMNEELRNMSKAAL